MRMGGPTYKQVQPKTYQVINQELDPNQQQQSGACVVTVRPNRPRRLVYIRAIRSHTLLLKILSTDCCNIYDIPA